MEELGARSAVTQKKGNPSERRWSESSQSIELAQESMSFMKIRGRDEISSRDLEIDARGGRNKKSAGDVHAVVS